MRVDKRFLRTVRSLVKAMPPCDVCGAPATRAEARGAARLCDVHGVGVREYPRARPLRAVIAHLESIERGETGACAAHGCKRTAYALGLCEPHYQRRRRGAELQPHIAERAPSADTCSEQGCKRPLSARGRCSRHYQEWRNNRLCVECGRPTACTDAEGDAVCKWCQIELATRRPR